MKPKILCIYITISLQFSFFLFFSLKASGGLVTESCPTLVSPWTVALQALVSMGLPRQGYWSGLPVPFPGYLPDTGMEPGSPALKAGSLPAEPPGRP